MGTPAFAVPTLEAMLQANWPIMGVVCQPDRPSGRGQKLTPPPIKELALAHGLPVHQPERIRRNPEFLELVRRLAPGLIVVVAYGQLLPPELLAIPPRGCLNVHASLLPHYRGAAPIQWALIRGEVRTGVTLMRMDVGMDTGDMVARAELAIAAADTAATLAPRLADLGARLAIAEIPRWLAGELTPEPQDGGRATMAPLLTKETGAIDWSRPAKELHDLVRGVQPWPGASGTLLGQVLKVVATRPVGGDASSAAPGTVLALESDGWHVATGHGALVLETIQVPGKPPRPAADVARGWRELNIGAQFT